VKDFVRKAKAIQMLVEYDNMSLMLYWNMLPSVWLRSNKIGLRHLLNFDFQITFGGKGFRFNSWLNEGWELLHTQT